jgi:hypothetical protein
MRIVAPGVSTFSPACPRAVILIRRSLPVCPADDDVPP